MPQFSWGRSRGVGPHGASATASGRSHCTSGGTLTGQTTGDPRPEKIEATHPTDRVEEFTADEEILGAAAFEGRRIDLGERDPPAGHLGFAVTLVSIPAKAGPAPRRYADVGRKRTLNALSPTGFSYYDGRSRMHAVVPIPFSVRFGSGSE
jgi:hypothetical protein